MKESKKYYLFFKLNIISITLPFVISLIIGLIYLLLTPPIYSLERILEFEHNQENINNINSAVDNTVFILRSASLNTQLNISPGTNIQVYKGSPVAVKLKVSSNQKSNIHSDMDKVQDFISAKNNVNQTGEDVFSLDNNQKVFTFLLLLSAGILIGIGMSLLKEYLTRY